MRYALLVLLVVGLSGCAQAGRDSQSDELHSDAGFMPVEQAKAGVEEVDRSRPDWLLEYCKERIGEVATGPIVHDRVRGPLHSLEPLYLPERFARSKEVETCTLDYYIKPVVEEAFVRIGQRHDYSQVSWDAYDEAITASVSAQLADEGYVKQWYEEDGKGMPDAGWYLSRPQVGIDEYLDVFYTKDEEVVFELIVMEVGK